MRERPLLCCGSCGGLRCTAARSSRRGAPLPGGEASVQDVLREWRCQAAAGVALCALSPGCMMQPGFRLT